MAETIPTKLSTLKGLKDDGVLTDEEFALRKGHLLDVYCDVPKAKVEVITVAPPVVKRNATSSSSAMVPAAGDGVVTPQKLWPWERLARFVNRLCEAYGWKYTAIACMIYGANGLGETFIGGAERYYFFDIQGVEAARYTQILAFAHLPWEVKAVYGMVSDSLSFCGLRRSPYLIIAGILGAASGFALWTIPVGIMGAAFFLTCVQFTVALADVMIDGSSGEKAHERPDMAADLQAIMHCASYLVGFFGDIVVGYIVDPDVVGSRGVFGLFIITALSFTIPTAMGWLGEQPQDEAPYDVGRMLGVYSRPKATADFKRISSTAGDETPVKNAIHGDLEETEPLEEEEEEEDEDAEIAKVVKTPIFIAACFNAGLSFIIGMVNLLYTGGNKVQVLGSLTISFATIMVLVLWFVLRPVSIHLAKGAIYIFLEGAFHPSTDIVFQWSHDDGEEYGNCSANCESHNVDDPDGCGWARERDYPCISPPIWGWAKACARIFGLLGVILYTTWFANWKYKEIFVFGHCVYFVANLLDTVWVTRTNVALGINDELFLFGSEIIQPVLRKLHTMPLLILSAKLCPKSVEATLFALMMGVWNFGSSVGKYNGVVLLYMFGGVESPEFKNIEPFIFLRTVMYLGPLLLVPIFGPDGGPNDGNYYGKKEVDADEDDVDKALAATKDIEMVKTPVSTKMTPIIAEPQTEPATPQTVKLPRQDELVDVSPAEELKTGDSEEQKDVDLSQFS